MICQRCGTTADETLGCSCDQAERTVVASGVYVSSGAVCDETAVYVSECACRAREVFVSGGRMLNCPECRRAVHWRILHVLRGSSTPEPPSSFVAPNLDVLLVTAKEHVARAVQLTLLAEQVEMTRVSSAAQAESATELRSFSVAVIDVRLPDGSGIDLAERLSDWGRVELVVFLAGSTLTLAERARAIGLGLVITRNSSREALLDAVLAAPASQRLRQRLR